MTVYAVGPGRIRAEMREQRLLATSVPCEYCHAPIGEPCCNRESREVLTRAPAHWCRLRDAEVPL